MDSRRRLVVAAVIAGCGHVGFDPVVAVDAPDVMIDPYNCGRVGHDCRLGACAAGTCQAFHYAQNESAPWGLAVDAANIYWTNDIAPGSIHACPLAGCPTSGPIVLGTDPSAMTRIAVDATSFYYTEFDLGSVFTCPLTGCAGAPITIETGDFQPMGVAVGGGNIYWAISGGTEIHMRPIGGGTVVTLANTSGPRTLVTDSTSIYWASAGGEVGWCPLDVCPTPNVLASGQNSPYFVSVYNGDVYWSNNLSPNGSIAKCAIGGCGGNPTTIAPSDFPLGIAVDDTGIYWVEGQASAFVKHCPLAGCGASGPTVLASGQNAPFSLAIDATAVYWTNSGDGTVSAIAKP